MSQAAPEKESVHSSHEIDLMALNEIRIGLQASPKSISPKYFYDEYGSQLFDQITRLPEYYPTRTEVAILTRYADEIAKIAGRGKVLLEPGAGSCSKVRHLLRALNPACYVPTDISRDYLFAAAEKLQQEFMDIPVYPAAGDMQSEVTLPPEMEGIQRLVFYPGSTIGNYTPEHAAEFLRHIRNVIGDDGGLLIGVDLQKDSAILNKAYNDAAGITAQFNLNTLTHINALTGSDFDLRQFHHIAFYNDQAGRIEMHLESQTDQLVTLPDAHISLAQGERILTEYSYKYSLEGFSELAAEAGLTLQQYWTDDENLFSLQYYAAQKRC
ncbi:MAG: L-histidine N(alpha)-methyltransferase [Halioglobus sp.]